MILKNKKYQEIEIRKNSYDILAKSIKVETLGDEYFKLYQKLNNDRSYSDKIVDSLCNFSESEIDLLRNVISNVQIPEDLLVGSNYEIFSKDNSLPSYCNSPYFNECDKKIELDRKVKVGQKFEFDGDGVISLQEHILNLGEDYFTNLHNSFSEYEVVAEKEDYLSVIWSEIFESLKNQCKSVSKSLRRWAGQLKVLINKIRVAYSSYVKKNYAQLPIYSKSDDEEVIEFLLRKVLVIKPQKLSNNEKYIPRGICLN